MQTGPSGDQHIDYCIICTEQRPFTGKTIRLADGRRAATGACPVCGDMIIQLIPEASD